MVSSIHRDLGGSVENRGAGQAPASRKDLPQLQSRLLSKYLVRRAGGPTYPPDHHLRWRNALKPRPTPFAWALAAAIALPATLRAADEKKSETPKTAEAGKTTVKKTTHKKKSKSKKTPTADSAPAPSTDKAAK